MNEGEEFKIQPFLNRYSGYQQTRLNTTKYLSFEMPYINVLSILLMVKKVYPQIHDYLKKQDVNESDISGIMEVYKCVRSDKKIEIIVPL